MRWHRRPTIPMRCFVTKTLQSFSSPTFGWRFTLKFFSTVYIYNQICTCYVLLSDTCFRVNPVTFIHTKFKNNSSIKCMFICSPPDTYRTMSSVKLKWVMYNCEQKLMFYIFLSNYIQLLTY